MELTTAFKKDPESIEPISVDWSDYLADLGVSISILSSTWIISGTGLTSSNDSVLAGGQQTQVFLAGGTAGSDYLVTNRIITDSVIPVTDDRSFQVIVQHK